MKKRFYSILLVLVALLISACSQATSSNDPAFVGTWKATITEGSTSYEVTGTFTTSTYESILVPTAGGTTDKYKGTLTYTDSTITDTQTEADTGSGYVANAQAATTGTWSVSGSTLTLTSGGTTSTYTKQ